MGPAAAARNKGKLTTSILLANYNGKHILEKTMPSIAALLNKSTEAIVLDNASADGSVEFLKKQYPTVKVVRNRQNLGFAGLNNAVAACRGKYILFLNNDIELHSASLKEMVKVMESSGDIALVAPKLVNYYNRKIDSGGTWLSRSFYGGHFRSDIAEGKVVDTPYIGSGLIRKDVIRKLGYFFDPVYFAYAEDVDLGLRIRLIGMRSVYAPKAILYHMHGATFKSSPMDMKIFLNERNLLITFFKIPRFTTVLVLLPYVLGMRLVAFMRDIVLLRWKNAFARLRAFFWIIFNTGQIMAKRKAAQKTRKIGDGFIFKVFTEKYLYSRKKIMA